MVVVVLRLELEDSTYTGWIEYLRPPNIVVVRNLSPVGTLKYWDMWQDDGLHYYRYNKFYSFLSCWLILLTWHMRDQGYTPLWLVTLSHKWASGSSITAFGFRLRLHWMLTIEIQLLESTLSLFGLYFRLVFAERRKKWLNLRYFY